MFLAGPKGCGKSFILLQAMQYCNARDWIVLYIPRGRYFPDLLERAGSDDLVIACSK